MISSLHTQVLHWITDTSLLPTGMDQQCLMDLHHRGTLDAPQAKCPHHIPPAPQGAGCSLQGLIRCMSFGLFNSAQLHPLIPHLQVSIPCHLVHLLTRPLRPRHLLHMAP